MARTQKLGERFCLQDDDIFGSICFSDGLCSREAAEAAIDEILERIHGANMVRCALNSC